MRKILHSDLIQKIYAKISEHFPIKSEDIDWSQLNESHNANVASELLNNDRALVKWKRFGKIVQINVDELRFKATYNDDTILATGLPTPVDTEIFYLSSMGGGNTPVSCARFRINKNGEFRIHYSTVTPNVSYGGTLMYFCAD